MLIAEFTLHPQLTMNESHTLSRLLRRFLFRGCAAALLVVLFGAVSAFGQGAISGRISNATTGANLEGAEVSIPGTALSTLTDRDGTFVLQNIPAGQHDVRVYYTGLE